MSDCSDYMVIVPVGCMNLPTFYVNHNKSICLSLATVEAFYQFDIFLRKMLNAKIPLNQRRRVHILYTLSYSGRIIIIIL